MAQVDLPKPKKQMIPPGYCRHDLPDGSTWSESVLLFRSKVPPKMGGDQSSQPLMSEIGV